MRVHTRVDAPHAGLPDDFIDWFAIAGPPDVARERFARLAALRLDFCWVAPAAAHARVLPGPPQAREVTPFEGNLVTGSASTWK
jgi:hypothetical protein